MSVLITHLNAFKPVEGVTSAPTFTVEDLTTSSPLGFPSQQQDRCIINVNYAGKHLHWHVIYDLHHPKAPPDFIFPDTSTFPFEDSSSSSSSATTIVERPFIELSKITSLSTTNWNSEDPNALQKVCIEILSYIRSKHREAALLLFPQQSLNAKKDFEKVVSSNDPSVEVFVESSSRISISLPLIFDPQQPSATLSIAFSPKQQDSLNSSSAEVKLVLPKGTINKFGGQLPKLPSYYYDTILTEYCQKVIDAIKSPSVSLTLRQHLFNALTKQFGNPLEYDPPLCRTIWFAFEDEKEHIPVLVHLTVSDGFPNEQPLLTLQSGMWNLHGKPLQIKYQTEYPYSPRWTHEEFAQRLSLFIKQKWTEFNQACIDTPGCH